MPNNWTASQAFGSVCSQIVDEWTLQLKLLLESKHLYQKVDVPISALIDKVRVNLGVHQPAFDEAMDLWRSRRLHPSLTAAKENTAVDRGTISVAQPVLLCTNIKLFCKQCEHAEVFSPLWARDAAEESYGQHQAPMPRKDSHQLVFIAFQCQPCQSDPEGFIVRRSGDKLYLEGRSPLEHVDVPKYLPKMEACFFSDAVVAQHAGKKLAALFYLRTFLEQYARRIANKEGRVTGEELMEAYTATLPQAHRDYMPSFREWYEKLSEALHAAREDDELFDNARSEIDRHLDIRRVFKISES